MHFVPRKHINLLSFLLFLSICFSNCNKTTERSSDNGNKLKKRADSTIEIIDYVYPETADYSYIIVKETPEKKETETRDTIDGIIVREPIIELDHLKNTETEKLRVEEPILFHSILCFYRKNHTYIIRSFHQANGFWPS